MGLYDREYVKNESLEGISAKPEVKAKSSLAAFIKQTYQLFAASMLAGAAGSYVGVGAAAFVSQFYWFIAIPWLLFGFFGLNMLKDKPGINMIALFAFTFTGGFLIGPLLSAILHMANGASLVANAFITTAVIFGALSVYAMRSERDFSSWGKPLMIAFVIVIIASLINVFFLKNPILFVVIEGIFLIIISAMVLYDTQNIIRGNYSSPIEGAIALYLDFLNMFITLLQMFGILGSDE